MITTAFLYLILAFANWAISQFAVFNPTGTVANAITAAGGYISAPAQVFPVTTFMACVAFVLAFDAVWIVYMMVRWVYQKIPGIN